MNAAMGSMRARILAAALLSPLAASGAPEAPRAGPDPGVRRFYLAPDDHTDYLWTADADTYSNAFVETLNYYLDLADATASRPWNEQSRWNCDGSFWMWTYERATNAAGFQRLIDRIKSGHITVPYNALVSTLGGVPVEAVIRGMYYSGRVERRHGLRFSLALAMENQTFPYGLASVWAGCGARYTWQGVCACATRVPASGDREHQAYWWEGSDGRRILVKWYRLDHNASFGGYAEARDLSNVVAKAEARPDLHPPAYPYDVVGIFGHGWDDLKTLTSNYVAAAHAQTTSNRLVVVSNERDFFEDLAAAHGPDLPVFNASFGNEWDLQCATLAEESARMKRALEPLRAAEALATIAAARDPAWYDALAAERERAWLAYGLYWEHDFASQGGVPMARRVAWQREQADAAEAYTRRLLAEATARVGAAIPAGGGAPRFFVFNPLSWTRTGPADLAWTGGAPVYVVDAATGAEAPSQTDEVDGVRLLRWHAADVPGLGYRVFEVRPGTGAAFAAAARADGNRLENAQVRVEVAGSGAITSFVDKARAGREFAACVRGRWLNDLGSLDGAVPLTRAGPVSVTLAAEGHAPLAHTTWITLFRDSPRVEIRNRIRQGFDRPHHWSFGFNLARPDVWHEEVGAILRARTRAAGGHYSDRAQNARYDYLTLNHFADMTGAGEVGVTLSNADGYFMKLGESTVGSLDTGTPLIGVLAGGRVDDFMAITNQGGTTSFLHRFALQAHGAYDPAAAMRFALEHQNPFVVGAASGGAGLPATTYAHLSCSDSNVFVWALKPHEDGAASGVVVRLWNITAQPRPVRLALADRPRAAWLVTHLETPLARLPPGAAGALELTLGPHRMETVHLVFQ